VQIAILAYELRLKFMGFNGLLKAQLKIRDSKQKINITLYNVKILK
jgi:hypothetical protein